MTTEYVNVCYQIQIYRNVQEKQSDMSCEDEFLLNCLKFQLGRMSVVNMRKVEPYTVDTTLNGKCLTF